MQKISSQLEKIKHSGKPGLMTHAVCGCPSLELSEKIALTMAEAGSDFIEIQIPFSDPVADGPVMMRANEIALERKTKVSDAFELAKRITDKLEIPILLMGYYNIFFKRGVEKFCKEARQAGASGLIFPDIPFDEAKREGLIKAAQKNNLAMIQVVSEITNQERLKGIKKYGQGFVYCTSRYGTTGTGKNFSKNLSKYLIKVKKITKMPLAVGFGISSKKDVDLVGKEAEIAVVGSAIMKMVLDKKISDKDKIDKIKKFIKNLR